VKRRSASAYWYCNMSIFASPFCLHFDLAPHTKSKWCGRRSSAFEFLKFSKGGGTFSQFVIQRRSGVVAVRVRTIKVFETSVRHTKKTNVAYLFQRLTQHLKAVSQEAHSKYTCDIYSETFSLLSRCIRAFGLVFISSTN